MASHSGKRVLIAAGLVILAAIGAAAWYFLAPGCSARLASCCLTTSTGYIRVEGGCDGLKVRILDQAGVVRGEYSVKSGLNTLSLDLPSEGQYVVELVYRGRVIDKVVASTEAPPEIVSAKALVSISGKVSIELSSRGASSCVTREIAGEYYVKEIDVVVEFSNGTVRNITFTGKWPASGTIVEDLGLKGPEFANVEKISIYIKDNLDRTYTAKVFFPR